MTTKITEATRYANVRGARSKKEVAAYLPDNYSVLGTNTTSGAVIICGVDFMGWTLDDYVIPRLGSGNMGCTEYVLDEDPKEG